MKSLKIYIFFIFLALIIATPGCSNQNNVDWTFYVIQGGSIDIYEFEDLYSMENSSIKEIWIDTEIRESLWEGPLVSKFGESRIVNYISEDFYLVSIPYREKVIACYKKNGSLLTEEDGGPLKIVSDPLYDCKCNWLKKLKIIEFIDVSKSLSIYGNVTSVIYLSGRDLNVFYSIQDVLDNTYNHATISQILSKPLPRESAETLILSYRDNREAIYKISDISDELVFYEDGEFNIPSLGIKGVTSIKVE